ncbi:BlaI/MecI/CopY family transcriptional regulator [Bombilactobacillus bombi]|uniref:BlaI/MecI/CopY family transcriptional regulator n=1 Tax=Bombilactobacillus bombi TaxID=1303590 RepID=UPI0015E5A6F3|nr:BlaI/MecI/CopY family transcriptional regulator [Bombilactobacillus bombi]MBA1435245.1 hypothetical protein [Bombilactobacillus bombi]
MRILTKREVDIMRVLWDSTESISSRDITRINPEISQNTVQALLRKLVDKGFIKTDGKKSTGTIYARKYRPIVSEKDYFLSQITPKKFQKFINAYISENNNENELKELERLVRKKLNEIK